MRFIGVDLASQPEKSSLCVLEWTTRPRVVELVRPADDDTIVAFAGEAGVGATGIDAPLGWPTPFVDVVARHHAGEPSGVDAVARRDLRLRTTDQVIRDHIPRDPLSVSTDRIGVVALRAIGLLERLLGPGADRSGGDGIYEAYPGGSLAVWGLPAVGYKTPDAGNRRAEIVAGLASVIEFGPHAPTAAANADDLNAVITAVVAGLAAAGRTTAPPTEHTEVARREGWIHVPTIPLDRLGEIRHPEP